ncbi:hypothetical protein OPV22_017789 [Ensete ventricosum]|uniref:Pectinesterase n=1 Tax=Ensete ventricosum TaxID=4639 RepID=A0AAV8QP27_ENSVE|nr:hypothetical protein OPV22_017789 [Ensete ventricosum]
MVKGRSDWRLRALTIADLVLICNRERTGGQVNWLGYHVITNANTAKAFTVASLIQGGSWLKKTGVAFVKEL